ncbi:hypothetical protein OCO53_00735 [Peribacillus frigoritolerans]|uniref:hypothetical protein n=1 Tax=Peribacillus frigoritolerans TaxID=450367 RepID=UPI0021CE2E87|nr:hypothetical protein [Peribacillus frigoritolerans]MCU6599001.1 hypothetical protein [Peribacillus frigoritolerans]
MMLKKMVDEYKEIKGKMIEAQKELGSNHHILMEYQNQIDGLYDRYFGVSKTEIR